MQSSSLLCKTMDFSLYNKAHSIIALAEQHQPTFMVVKILTSILQLGAVNKYTINLCYARESKKPRIIASWNMQQRNLEE